MGEEGNGSEVETVPGGRIEVQLPTNPSTGYTWVVSELPGCLWAVPVQEYEPEAPGMIGGGGKATLVFIAVRPGSGRLELGYLRIWEVRLPARTFEIIVRVLPPRTSDASRPDAP